MLIGDGAAQFITDSVEAGSRTAPMVFINNAVANDNQAGAKSPYGFWGRFRNPGVQRNDPRRFLNAAH